MTEPRIACTKEAARRLGVTPHTFNVMRKEKGFPKPLMERRHHLFWDMKAIEQYLDNAANINTQSLTDHASIIRERLASLGKHKSELSH